MEEEGSISSKQQFLFKLKIPKLEGVEEEEDDDLEEGEIKEDDIGSKDSKPNPSSKSNPKRDNNRIRVCPECFKEFSSGKALGGHMRIHVQQQQQPPNSHKKNLHYPKQHNLKPTQTTRFKKTHNPKLMEKHPQPDYLRSCVDGNGQPVCSLCGKNFPSIKSLFGHMRCHPEREWRGILPPDQSVVPNSITNNRKSSSSSSLSDDFPSRKTISYGDGDDDSAQDQEQEVVDLTQALPRWAVRAKRGRKVVVTPEISTSSQEDKEEEVQFRDAAEDLMRLAHGDQSFDESGLTHKQRVDEFEATNSNSLTDKGDSASKKRKFSELKYVSPPFRMDKWKGKALMETKPLKLECDEYGGNSKDWSDKELSDSNEQLLINYKYRRNANCESPDNGKVVMKKNSVSTTPNKKKRKKMKLMMDLELGQDVSPPTPPSPTPPPQAHQKPNEYTPDKYKCSTCNKSFPTHQALGGHRSSHNKFKITILNAVEQEEDVDDGKKNVNLEDNVKERETVGGGGAAMASGSTHQCKICNKIFPTGQALGGHKRCHWSGPADQGPSSQVTSPGEASQTAGDRKVMEFDLNEVPPPENEGGDASSSYNSNMVS